jgi:hypothetical protein
MCKRLVCYLSSNQRFRASLIFQIRTFREVQLQQRLDNTIYQSFRTAGHTPSPYLGRDSASLLDAVTCCFEIWGRKFIASDFLRKFTNDSPTWHTQLLVLSLCMLISQLGIGQALPCSEVGGPAHNQYTQSRTMEQSPYSAGVRSPSPTGITVTRRRDSMRSRFEHLNLYILL